MTESPSDKTKRCAVDAITERVRELIRVHQDAMAGPFERGQQLFLRWADGTRDALSEHISEAEAERFEEVTGLHTYQLLDQYFQEYSNYLEALLLTLERNPNQLFRCFGSDRPNRY